MRNSTDLKKYNKPNLELAKQIPPNSDATDMSSRAAKLVSPSLTAFRIALAARIIPSRANASTKGFGTLQTNGSIT